LTHPAYINETERIKRAILVLEHGYRIRDDMLVRPKRKSNKVSGFVYLIKSPTGHYKIGKARDVDNRISLFSVKLPFEIELLHTIPCEDYTTAELWLHEQYSDKRVNGEWFSLTSEDVETIKGITKL